MREMFKRILNKIERKNGKGIRIDIDFERNVGNWKKDEVLIEVGLRKIKKENEKDKENVDGLGGMKEEKLGIGKMNKFLRKERKEVKGGLDMIKEIERGIVMSLRNKKMSLGKGWGYRGEKLMGRIWSEGKLGIKRKIEIVNKEVEGLRDGDELRWKVIESEGRKVED